MSDSSSAARSGSLRGRLHRFVMQRSNWLFAVIIIVLIAVQWPLVKGVLYPWLGIEAAKSSIDWREDYSAAMEEAAATGRLVLLDFTADWCPPCRAMKYSTWPDSRVEELAGEHFVPVVVDVDQPRNASLMSTYNIRSIPAILIIDETGQVRDRGGYMSSGDMTDFLEKHAHP